MSEKELTNDDYFINDIQEAIKKCVDLRIPLTFINHKNFESLWVQPGKNKVNLMLDYKQILNQINDHIANHMADMVDERKLKLAYYYDKLLNEKND
jgi:hypothetical protein